MAKRDLALRISSLQNALIRDANDMHIFLNQAVPLLEYAKTEYATSRSKRDRRYYVPSIGRTKFAKRKDTELKEIYDRFANYAIYEAFLVTAVSRFESFLSDVLREVFLDYPKKLGSNAAGISGKRQVPVEVLLEARDIKEAIEETIRQHLTSVFYAGPSEYLSYVGQIVGVNFPSAERDKYLEIKATRDLMVHGSGTINALYISRSGSRARGSIGDEALVDQKYFDASLATMKRLAGAVKRDAEKTFPRNEERANSQISQTLTRQ